MAGTHFKWNVLTVLLFLQDRLFFRRFTLTRYDTGSSKSHPPPSPPVRPLSPPPCSRPHTSKLLTRHTLSEFLTPVPPSLLTSSPVIVLDCRAASHLFSLLSLLSLSLPSCSLATRHLPHPPPRLGTGVLPASLPPLYLLASCPVPRMLTYLCRVGVMLERSVIYWTGV